MQDLIRKFQSIEDDDELTEFFMDNVVKKGIVDKFTKSIKEHSIAKEMERRGYYYMLTFTLDPKKHAFTDRYYDRVEKYIRGLVNNKAWNLLFFAYVREGGDEDHKHVHWHVSIKCSKALGVMKNIQYYKKRFGNVDKSRSKHSNNISAHKYMSKQSEPIVLLGSWDDVKLDPNPNPQKSRIEWKPV